MGAQERERKVYRPLRRAGLKVIPDAVPAGTIPFVLGYGAEDVAGGFSYPYDTPKLVERLNESWYDLAVSAGLFDDRRESLLQLPQGVRSHQAIVRDGGDGDRGAPEAWTRVRLLDRWDIMGRGAQSAFLGIHAGHPGFGMPALDGSVYIRCSTGERGVDVLEVRRPDRSESVLRFLERIVAQDEPFGRHREFKKRIAAWLRER
ncbi:hypothetical protein ABZ990_23160 [Streptomyces sp. NPDC046203]|uniref:hypothetical protein n=1 Tax=Streptomyces sp. NPDC046203 TaxID=3154602 RepID=UPI0033DAED07